MAYALVYVTNPNKQTASKLANQLVRRRLIACANIFPIDSIYWWKGKIEKSREWVLLAKTTGSNFKKLEKAVKKLHPYDVSDITRIKVSANKDYEKWVKSEVR